MYCIYIFLCTCIPVPLSTYVSVVQVKGILKNRTQIEEWIEDKAIRRRWQHSRHQDDSDSEEEEEGSNLSQVSGGELNALHTLIVDIQVAVTGWVMPQVSSPHFIYIHTTHVCSGGSLGTS